MEVFPSPNLRWFCGNVLKILKACNMSTPLELYAKQYDCYLKSLLIPTLKNQKHWTSNNNESTHGIYKSWYRQIQCQSTAWIYFMRIYKQKLRW